MTSREIPNEWEAQKRHENLKEQNSFAINDDTKSEAEEEKNKSTEYDDRITCSDDCQSPKPPHQSNSFFFSMAPKNPPNHGCENRAKKNITWLGIRPR